MKKENNELMQTSKKQIGTNKDNFHEERKSANMKYRFKNLKENL